MPSHYKYCCNNTKTKQNNNAADEKKKRKFVEESLRRAICKMSMILMYEEKWNNKNSKSLFAKTVHGIFPDC